MFCSNRCLLSPSKDTSFWSFNHNSPATTTTSCLLDSDSHSQPKYSCSFMNYTRDNFCVISELNKQLFKQQMSPKQNGFVSENLHKMSSQNSHHSNSHHTNHIINNTSSQVCSKMPQSFCPQSNNNHVEMVGKSCSLKDGIQFCLKICDFFVVASMQNDRQKRCKRKRRKRKKDALEMSGFACEVRSESPTSDCTSLSCDEYDSFGDSFDASCDFDASLYDALMSQTEDIRRANETWESHYIDVPATERQSERVKFVESKPKVKVMHVWDFAMRKARIGIWEQMARDRMRFSDRIKKTGNCIDNVLNSEHRLKVYRQRFI